MPKSQKISTFLLRITMGWMFLYAGWSHLIDPNFSAAGYLAGAKTLLGISLILGIGVRLSAKLGALLMILYWLPLGILHPDAHSLIVDDHVIYAAALLVLSSMSAGRIYGLENWCSNLPLCSKYPKLRRLLG